MTPGETSDGFPSGVFLNFKQDTDGLTGSFTSLIHSSHLTNLLIVEQRSMMSSTFLAAVSSHVLHVLVMRAEGQMIGSDAEAISADDMSHHQATKNRSEVHLPGKTMCEADSICEESASHLGRVILHEMLQRFRPDLVCFEE